ncbi:4-hydroxy-tetrahydrodipicolinate reductase [Pararhodobacter oceanensis]|uniref:4-hydroxy-tetrahydrodipicolinate reductase n=1 Tax=Pararhodobacter oceanensis TaxID=2172121 RepID=A0A2T8HR57_9RHOB|nr:4-hydroxy-tetrahydrodipicolinate reductase [Pararhodobacter oceanensis]PVH27906.1 4-hydroxy-tetrahydrodipicolinate reductase [Pararhodobacter oceanensis]
MSEPLAIVVNGVSGRMGRMLVEVINASDKARVCGALERPGHAWVGKDLGEMLGGTATSVIVGEDPAQVLKGAQAVIDFTAPAATVALARTAAQMGVAHIIGTTGFTPAHLAELQEIAQAGVIVRAGNMSLGVNLLTALTRKVAEALDSDYDIEIIEGHHRHKVDAPSGTALMLGEAAAEGRGVSLEDHAVRARDGITGAREKGSIGFAVVRGGDIIGEHDVMFAADGERLILRHIASDRAVFARGALKAALWAQGREAGEYDMMAVLGL